jgi:hypothetical protein
MQTIKAPQLRQNLPGSQEGISGFSGGWRSFSSMLM